MTKKQHAATDALALMDDTAEYVATLTGFKRQLVDAGWTEPMAEEIVAASVWSASGAAEARGRFSG